MSTATASASTSPKMATYGGNSGSGGMAQNRSASRTQTSPKSASDSRLSDTEKFRIKYQSVSRELAAERKLNQQLLSEQSTKRSELTRMKFEMQRAQADLNDSTLASEYAKRSTETLTQKHDRLRDQLQKAREDRDELQVLLEQQRQQEAVARSTIQKLELQRNALEMNMAEEDRRFMATINERRRAEQEIQGLKREILKTRRALEAIQKDLDLFDECLESGSDDPMNDEEEE